jgi:hypothetical protein
MFAQLTGHFDPRNLTFLGDLCLRMFSSTAPLPIRSKEDDDQSLRQDVADVVGQGEVLIYGR